MKRRRSMKRMKRKKQKKSGSGICKQTALRKSLLIGKKKSRCLARARVGFKVVLS